MVEIKRYSFAGYRFFVKGLYLMLNKNILKCLGSVLLMLTLAHGAFADTIFLVANEDEAQHLQPLESDSRRIIIIGEGRSNVIRTLAAKIKDGKIKADDTIINVGYVGAKGIEKGQIVKVSKVSLYLPSKTVQENPIELNTLSANFHQKDDFTAENFITADDERVAELPEKCVIDMELYYIALMLPEVMSVKIVSDSLNFEEYQQANFATSWETVIRELEKL